MMTVTTKVHFTTTRAGRKRLNLSSKRASAVPAGRIPRISKLMALAIRFDGLLREGKVADQSELARLAHVTQPRMTQIMNRNQLAPDIQEELLFLPHVHRGHDSINERSLRPIAGTTSWSHQRRQWRRFLVFHY